MNGAFRVAWLPGAARHSHPIANKLFFYFYFQCFTILLNGGAMKNTLFRKIGYSPGNAETVLPDKTVSDPLT